MLTGFGMCSNPRLSKGKQAQFELSGELQRVTQLPTQLILKLYIKDTCVSF